MKIDSDQKLDALRVGIIDEAAIRVGDDLRRLINQARTRQRRRTLHPKERATEAAKIHLYQQLIEQLDETGFLPGPEEVSW